MDFMTELSLSIEWKGDSYNSILVVVNWLAKMIHYEPVKITINVAGLAEVIKNVIL